MRGDYKCTVQDAEKRNAYDTPRINLTLAGVRNRALPSGQISSKRQAIQTYGTTAVA